MKRRRGNKKGKAKKAKTMGIDEVASSVASLNTEENSGLDDNDDVNSGRGAETLSSAGPEQPEKPAKDNSAVPVDNLFGKAVYGRVKVKIKTSKALESHLTSSDAPTQSDTDKSSQQVGSDKLGVLGEKIEDSANSLPETNKGLPGNPSRKSMGIKIKSSRGFGSSSMSPCSNSDLAKGDKTEQKELKSVDQHKTYNEQELKAALEVIRKVMKMEAAEPFNVPVNPVALGIPDYFDVIDTPMDFGTICSNLEKGAKYMDSEDVFRDVQYIWDNCYKYNNKGDYIVELMKRVRKNFTKLWVAASLYSDQPQENNGAESNQIKDDTNSSLADEPEKSGNLSLTGKKFHGLKKHKDGCLCAICVMMRRRQEREEIARIAAGHTEGSDDSIGDEIRLEGASPLESSFGGYNSADMDADFERKEGVKLGDLRNLYTSIPDKRTSLAREGENPDDYQISSGILSSEIRREDGTALSEQPKPKELDETQKAKMYENLRYLENPMLLALCGTLFVDNSKSFWSGPHSLVKFTGSRRKSSIHDAVSTFMR